MKNKNSGYIVPALLGIIALLIIGGGIYVYQDKKGEQSSSTHTEVQPQTNTQTPVVTQPTVPPPPVTNKAVITVTSPNGGETFKQGSPITVKWTQSYSAAASICLMGDAGCVYRSTPGTVYKAGANTWTIPENINIATCTISTCYIADGFKVVVTTENPPGSNRAGDFISDASDNYFVILPQTDLQAFLFLQHMQSQIGSDSRINPSVGSTIPTFRIDLAADKFAQAEKYLSSFFGGQSGKYASERGSGYENWHLLCMSIALGAGSTPSDLPYVTCKDKIGSQTVGVKVADIKSIDTDTRTFLLTLGMETMKIRMPAVVQNTQYQNGTFADFVKAVTSAQYKNGTFEMTGEVKGDAFEVMTIKWLLG